MIELAVRRFAWEVNLDPFATPDPFTQPSFLRGPEFRRHPSGHWEERLEQALANPYPDQGGAPTPMWTSRGPGSRHMACLSVLDNLLMLGLLARVEPELQRRFAATDSQQDWCFQMAPGISWLRSPYTSLPYEQAGLQARQGREAFRRSWQGRSSWHVQADVASCGTSMDRRRLGAELAACGLNRPQRRQLSGLLSRLALGPRYGVRSFGNGLCVLVKFYLQPVLLQLLALGYDALLMELDEFHLFVDSPSQGLRALEALEQLLGQRGLALNPSKTHLKPLAPPRPSSRKRLWWPDLRNDRFASQGPRARAALHSPLYQEAARRVLLQGRTGDRYQVLYWLERAGVRPRGRLRSSLEARLSGADAIERDFLELLLNS